MAISINAQCLKKAMFLKGYNFSDLSTKADISKTYLSHIMNGKRTPSPKMAKKIADSLDVDIEDIFKLEIKEA